MDVILQSFLCPGDLLMMTCAVRDLVNQYGWDVGVLTSVPAIWMRNPYLRRLDPKTTAVYGIGYNRAMGQSGRLRDLHFSRGYILDINALLNLSVTLSDLRPDVHLDREERNRIPYGLERPYWVVLAGGKKCFVTKWWDPAYYQQVVNMTSEIRWVQLGLTEHVHFPLTGTINLLDKTNLREALRIIANADGVLCPLTFSMHAAAAFNRPCVCIAGGREPPWWEAYTRRNWESNVGSKPPDDLVEHQFLHSIGQLDCCRERGCWKTHLEHKQKQKNCLHIEQGPTMKQPRCLTRITPDRVVEAIYSYGASRRARTYSFSPAVQDVGLFTFPPQDVPFSLAPEVQHA